MAGRRSTKFAFLAGPGPSSAEIDTLKKQLDESQAELRKTRKAAKEPGESPSASSPADLQKVRDELAKEKAEVAKQRIELAQAQDSKGKGKGKEQRPKEAVKHHFKASKPIE